MTDPVDEEHRATATRARRHTFVLPRNYATALAAAKRLHDAGREPWTAFDVIVEIHSMERDVVEALARAGSEHRYREGSLQMAGTTLSRALAAMAKPDRDTPPLLELVEGQGRPSRRNRYRITPDGLGRAEHEVINLAARANPPYPPLLEVIGAVLGVGGGADSSSPPAPDPTCRLCFHHNQPGARFCSQCGQPL